MNTDQRISSLLQAARDRIARRTKLVDASEEILRRLPEEILRRHVWISDDWIQISSLSRAQVEMCLSLLHGGKWSKKTSSGRSEFLDYETTINGVCVILYCAAPPGSCRIVEEKIEIPAQTITVRKLLCAASPMWQTDESK